MLLIVDAPCTIGGRWAGAMPVPRGGACWPGLRRGQGKTPQTLTEKCSLCPHTWRQVVRGLNPSDTGNNSSPIDSIHPQPQWGRGPSRPPSLSSCALCGTHPDYFSVHSHGPNLWQPHYCSLGCYRGRVTKQGTNPYVRNPPGHALTLTFSRPVGICARGIPEPSCQALFAIPEVSRVSLPRAWGLV